MNIKVKDNKMSSKDVVVLLSALLIGILAYNLGAYMNIIHPINTTTLYDYREINCDDIVRYTDEQNNRGKLVCEITMTAEDDNIRIFSGKGSIDD